MLNAEQAHGEKTYLVNGVGVSTVDFVLVQRQAMRRVRGMAVDDADFISDHRALRLT